MVSHMETSAITEVGGAVVSGMMAAMSGENIDSLAADHQSAVLDSIGADLMGSNGAGFEAIESAGTNFDQMAPTDEAAPSGQAATEAFSVGDLFTG